jgi:hypothetical protein
MELGEHLDAFFHSQLLKVEAALGDGLAKSKFCTDSLVFKAQ